MADIIIISASYAECRTMGWGGKHEFPGLLPTWLSEVEEITRPNKQQPSVAVLSGYVTFRLMGEHTFDNRVNIVMTRSKVQIEGCTTVSSLEELFNTCNQLDAVYIIGGYNTFANICRYVEPDQIFLLQITGRAKKQGLRFPRISQLEYIELSRVERPSFFGAPPYSLVQLLRIQRQLL